ncbi:HAD-superfamily hydrolase, subfamily IA, variant 3 [Methylobacterium sp. 4-46]|uniref:HAD family hydrolase n=1 Tax=unclassified Methylobacterium TaxID=2615210 RepID=UPI000165C957|nr:MULTISPECIES: HAD family hydrolase [Methylobacterium]ACA16640.1 HAD-superfamily hydrolase, subfamily IA, variant 3 [Methylobacterium sp. 4-46]WFT82343.1 HAD family hydrolase [Methylobacterium nodulans]
MDGTGRPDLVIFDCDGVLIDSEPISLARLTANLNRIGVPIDRETVGRRFTGTSMTSIMAHIAADYGVAAPEGFVREVRADTLRAFEAELTAIAGVAEVLARLPGRRCVASSSDPTRLAHALTLTGLLPLFDGHVFSASMVARGKPHPDLFLFAAERMRADPAACLVIEDSVPGVTAARAAGMRVFGFSGGGHWRHDPAATALLAAGAALVFDDFLQLPDLIGA